MNKLYRILIMTAALAATGFGLSSSSQAATLNQSNSQWLNTESKAITSQGSTINPNVLKLGLTAYLNAHKQGYDSKGVLTVIDYSQPSTQKRLWVFDLNSGKTLFNTWVAHGKNSGDLKATSFSNSASSLKTSLGLFVTDATYMGHHGLSLRLRGLEAGYNSNAYNRSVVVHGAAYVSAQTIKEKGRLGRSWGCPALNPTIAPLIINAIKSKTLVFSYYPDQQYLSHSHYLVA